MPNDIMVIIHCAKPPFPGRPSSCCPRREGAAPPPTHGGGSGLSYHVFRGAMTWRYLASWGVRLRRQGTVKEGRGGCYVKFI